jgi:large subunit ribosomal protein L23
VRQILRRPLISEKNTTHLGQGVYAFEVDKTATKTEVKTAVEKSFRVKVASVRTMVNRDKSKRTKFGVSLPRAWKKALIRLAPGNKIGIFEGV